MRALKLFLMSTSLCLLWGQSGQSVEILPAEIQAERREARTHISTHEVKDESNFIAPHDLSPYWREKKRYVRVFVGDARAVLMFGIYREQEEKKGAISCKEFFPYYVTIENMRGSLDNQVCLLQALRQAMNDFSECYLGLEVREQSNLDALCSIEGRCHEIHISWRPKASPWMLPGNRLISKFLFTLNQARHRLQKAVDEKAAKQPEKASFLYEAGIWLASKVSRTTKAVDEMPTTEQMVASLAEYDQLIKAVNAVIDRSFCRDITVFMDDWFTYGTLCGVMICRQQDTQRQYCVPHQFDGIEKKILNKEANEIRLTSYWEERSKLPVLESSPRRIDSYRWSNDFCQKITNKFPTSKVVFAEQAL